LPKSADEFVIKVGKMSLKELFYFRSAGHLLRKVGKLRSNDPRRRVIWTAAQVKK